jgi:hypothetical protein
VILPPPPEGSTPEPEPGEDGDCEKVSEREERTRFKAFPYSGVNDYMILCDNHFLSMGGG